MEYPSKKEMEDYLKSRGWSSLWHNDNWIDMNKDYKNIDWVGTSLEKAYQYVVENEYLYDIVDYEN